ncbi:MAG TPA: cobyrinate a,c-diamide synthase [Clostridiaceae bacterium]
MKSMVISSNCSGGGKTTLTLGIMKAIIKRGFEVQGYKVGPDYIDTAFHKHVTGKASRNLDLFLMGEAGAKAAYSRGKGEFGVVEGVMGLYDGKGIDSEYSTAHLARILNLPIVLVITPQAQSVTLCAELNGICNFEAANVVGVILNNINEKYYKLLKAAIEKNCSPNLKVFGYVPKDENLALKSRHLGLVQSSEVDDLDNKIEICSQHLEAYVDIDSLLHEFKEAEEFQDNFHMDNMGLKTAVAYDRAFNFYYKENIELLEELGTVVYFSPLKDEKLPEDIDFLYLGGGYPEVFISELSNNKSMLNSIKNSLNNGLKCYAECGGLMYLTNSIEGQATVGFFQGTAHMGTVLQNFGYAQVRVAKENSMVEENLKINCHQFHNSFVALKEETIFKISADEGVTESDSGYHKNSTIGTYAHIHCFGNMNFIKSIFDKSD